MSGVLKVAALIPAAGFGTRLGQGPKAYLDLGGLSLLARSVAALAPHVDEVVVALPEGFALPEGIPARVVIGGATRQASVLALLRATDAEVVLIHDAARPFLPPEVIRTVRTAAAETGAATAALPVADTLVRGQGQASALWGELTARENLWAVQTPQGFRRELLLSAHLEAEQGGIQATDDAGLVARLGLPVVLIPGDARLFKVTTPSDLALARALVVVWDAEDAD
ncbi:2-C-methyl-D-erythritol 4-phosphate cytidylyltransferase [Deinococcus rubellus]|uniref:2-C-methyl-D-erythritol 4-phosphate cytidylyltransferase n=1 Tax=Deinococcus rubellus TaxID=1889240 RepID=A0ABY5YGB0_9DEIO|nr:2-C-methyl-D-erythritol 4-phosphate cytidylyltransferase [Deinococcus rubellus]UWX63986.1 2-C-methyl-D-erythritol 4-phosphate cytidylyltransferase [Deinococcus rubellus]